METPKTLQQAAIFFANPDNCVAYVASKRWPDGVVTCPNCGAEGAKYMPTRCVWQCKTRHPKSQFSVKVGSIYEDSALGLDKWLLATWMVVNCKNGVSSYEIARSIGVTQKSAWFMLHRIRESMKDVGTTLSGVIEMDETFVGGKVKNMHKSRVPKGTGHSGRPVGAMAKTIVVGMMERGGRVKAQIVKERTQEVLGAIAKENIEYGSILVTDEWGGYNDTKFAHEVINHAETYVRGQIHTNGIENFWSLLKRGLGGTYIAVEPFHLIRYIDEQAFRYNNRKNVTDGVRLSRCVEQGFGRRLTYKTLTGKTQGAF